MNNLNMFYTYGELLSMTGAQIPDVLAEFFPDNGDEIADELKAAYEDDETYILTNDEKAGAHFIRQVRAFCRRFSQTIRAENYYNNAVLGSVQNKKQSTTSNDADTQTTSVNTNKVKFNPIGTINSRTSDETAENGTTTGNGHSKTMLDETTTNADGRRAEEVADIAAEFITPINKFVSAFQVLLIC